MKKILYVRSAPFDLNPNSYNCQEIGMGKAFVRLGYNFDFVAFKSKDQKEYTFFEQNGCKARIIEKPRLRVFRWGINTSICNKDFLSQYDYIISSEYYQLMTYLLSRKVDNVFMYSGPYYNLFFLKFISPIYDLLCTKSIDKKIKVKFVKSVLAKEFLEHKGYHNVVNVGVGLDATRFFEENHVEEETAKVMDFMTKNKCILYVGSLSDRKNLPFMIQLYKRVYAKDPSVKFVMIGKSVINPLLKLVGKKDEDYEKKAFASLTEEEKAGILRIHGIKNPQLKYIYPLAKAFILPSKKEIFGMVLLEAMYLGAPVITSRNGGSLTLIQNGVNGYIIDEFNTDVWCERIFPLINNESLKERISNNAKETISKEYLWDAVVKRMSSHMI